MNAHERRKTGPAARSCSLLSARVRHCVGALSRCFIRRAAQWLKMRNHGRRLFVLPTLLCSMTSVCAQILSPNLSPEFHKPRSSTQATPMRVRVIDATSFADIETQVVYRLYGVDACSISQVAVLGRQPWPCGVVAVSWMVTATLNKWVTCAEIRMRDAERLVRCATAEHADLAADMIKEGIAVTPPELEDRQIKAYVSAEIEARKAYRGIWGSEFQMPWTFRQSQAPNPSYS